MDASKLKLMARDDFAALSLHAKNDYLQGLASRFCAMTERPQVELTKDALARLRRFYSRRSLAELGVKTLPENDLGRALAALGNAIKEADRKTDLLGALKSELPAPVMREAPLDDSQLVFFVPGVYDAPIKDDVNLLDVAPFSLSKNKRLTTLRYELKDSIITVGGSAEHGLATVFDYDIVLHMISYLAEEYRSYKIDEERGLRPHLPARVYRPNTAHILKFARRSSGGKQYKDLEAALDRLKGTNIKIVNLANSKRREAVSVSLIEDYRVISNTTNGHVDQVEIRIPDWIYTSVVREKGAPQILTLNPDYFLISQGIGRMIYRLARKAAGKGEARYSLATLHHRSGSTQAPPQFAQMVRKLVENTQTIPLPDYDLELVDGSREPLLRMKYRAAPVIEAPVVAQSALPLS